MGKEENCHHQDDRRGRKCPNKDLADTPAEPVRWQQEPGTDLPRIWDQEQESKRSKINLPCYQCYRVDRCKKSASETKDGAGAKGSSRSDKFPNRDGGESGDCRQA